jgi:hypothetical protein
LPERDNTPNPTPLEVQKRLSDKLLTLDFVSGIGSPGGGLTIYLTRALKPEEQQEVKKLLDAEAPGKPVEFVTTGKFKAH